MALLKPPNQRLLSILFFFFVGLSSFIGAQELTDAQIDVVNARLSEAAQKRSVVKACKFLLKKILIYWLVGNLGLSLKPFLSETQRRTPFSQTNCCRRLPLCQVPNVMHLCRSSTSLLGSYHLRPKTRLVHNHLCPGMEAQQTRRQLVYVF
jgi:hypothetical protein